MAGELLVHELGPSLAGIPKNISNSRSGSGSSMLNFPNAFLTIMCFYPLISFIHIHFWRYREKPIKTNYLISMGLSGIKMFLLWDDRD